MRPFHSHEICDQLSPHPSQDLVDIHYAGRILAHRYPGRLLGIVVPLAEEGPPRPNARLVFRTWTHARSRPLMLRLWRAAGDMQQTKSHQRFGIVYVPTQPILKIGYVRSALHSPTALMTLQRRLQAHGNFDLPAMAISSRSPALPFLVATHEESEIGGYRFHLWTAKGRTQVLSCASFHGRRRRRAFNQGS